ncbi:MAG: glycosyltransferase 87 family protein [Bryobacteraceae bacterium]
MRSRLAVLVFATFLVLLGRSFRQAWIYTESDFPSYYTAAHLVLEKQPLREFYDMPRFQQHIDIFVTPSRLGGYIPQTPLTMLRFVPLTGFTMQEAKRLWLLADLVFLGGTIWLLTRMTNLGVAGVVGLLVLGAGSLHTNLVLGQYYVFVLFLLTAAGYLLNARRSFLAGAILGLICSLKLITIPFVLYFAWRRQAKAIAGMCAAIAVCTLVTVALFGWSDLAYYAGTVLPRSLAGETLDPFNPANGTLATLLRRLLVREPELNPSPLLDFPPLFSFLRAFFVIAVLSVSLLGFGRAKNIRISYAGFLLTLLLLSPNTASYTFLLLVVPTALLLDHANLRYRIPLVLCYLFLAIPMRPAWSWMFPKVWILGTMFWLAMLVAGVSVRNRPAFVAVSTAGVLALAAAGFTTITYATEANRRWQAIAVEPGAIYSSSPIPVQGGLVYQSIRDGRYQLLIPRGTPLERLTKESSTSPSGQWVVSARPTFGSTQIYLVDRQSGKTAQVTRGNCNSFAPAWEEDSAAIVFASDCGRGLGMPALYRARLKDVLAESKR